MSEPAENLLPLDTKPTAEAVLVTPEMAQRWLEANSSNRNMREAIVAQYARDMRSGNWQLTGEAIKLSTSGRLIDGQHRCAAVVTANTPVLMFVVRGLTDQSQQVMDSGVKRSASDQLRMSGVPSPQSLAAAARIGCIVDAGVLFQDRKKWQVSNSEVLTWVKNNRGIIHSCAYVLSGEPAKVEMRPSIRGYCHFRFAALDEDAANEFFSSLGSLIAIPAGSPIHALSSRLRQIDRQRTKAELPHMLHMTFRAWNAWRKGRQMSVIPLVPARGIAELPDLV